jgi:hypothetical protein
VPELPLQLDLSGERLALYEALFRRSERIARMYLGIHYALRDSANPERFVQAAHCARELMEKVPEIVAVIMTAHSEQLRAKVTELEQAFLNLVPKSKLKPPNWDGECDGPMKSFMKKANSFFDWKQENMPKRREEIARTMRALDGPSRGVPSDLEELAVNEWLEIKSHFVNLAHHQTSDPNPEEFDARLTSLERILLRKLNPSTFADFDALDAIIEAGEAKHDKP